VSVTEGRSPFRTHYLPRTRPGWVAWALFWILIALAQPPVVTGWPNTIEPRFFDLPFLYVYVSLVYVALVVLLVWSRIRGL
jgi:uncharacterized membrane protein